MNEKKYLSDTLAESCRLQHMVHFSYGHLKKWKLQKAYNKKKECHRRKEYSINIYFNSLTFSSHTYPDNIKFHIFLQLADVYDLLAKQQ